MGKSAAIFAITAAFLVLGGGQGVRAAELLKAGQGAPVPGVFFDIPTSVRLLEDVEQCRAVRNENLVLRRLDEKNRELDQVRTEREALLRERIAFLEKQNQELISLNERMSKTMDVISKSEGGIFDKLKNNFGYIGIGIGIGILIGI